MTLILAKIDQEPLGKRRWRAHVAIPSTWTDFVDVSEDGGVLIITGATPDAFDELAHCLLEAGEEARSIGPKSAGFWQAE